MKKILFVQVLLLVNLVAHSQNYTFSLFNKADALKYGIPYFKGNEGMNKSEMMFDYKLADDFAGSVDLSITFKNIGSCKTPCKFPLAYAVEMKATITNNTNHTLVGNEVRVAFPKLPLGADETVLYIPTTCEPSGFVCSLGPGIDRHMLNSTLQIPFNSAGAVTECGIYPPNSYLILKAGESRTVTKREWLTKTSVSQKPFFERGLFMFCPSKSDKSTPRNNNNQANNSNLKPSGGNSSNPNKMNLTFQYDDRNWKEGDSYAFMNFDCPEAGLQKQHYVTEVFRYNNEYLTDDVLKNYWNYLRKETGLTLHYNDLTEKAGGRCHLYLEKGIRSLSEEEANEIRNGIVKPLERRGIPVNIVKVKINNKP